MVLGEFLEKAPFSKTLVFFLNHAISAPSAFNTQPWQFIIKDDCLHVYPDLSRWLKIADSEQRQLYLSLGCVLENIIISAVYFGFKTNIRGNPKELILSFTEAPLLAEGGLFEALSVRKTYYGSFETREVEQEKIDIFMDMVTEPISLQISNDKRVLAAIDGLCLRSDIVQYEDPLYRKELNALFQEGILDCNVMIEKLGRFASSFQGKSSIPLKGAPLICSLTAKESNPKIWVEAGRIFERIYLTCAQLGLKIKPVNSNVVEPNWREEFKAIFSCSEEIPLQPFIIGYGNDEVFLRKKKRALEDMLTVF